MRRSVNASRTIEGGFTLLECVFTIVLLAVLTRYALVKGAVTPAAMTLRTQAESVADLVRRAQSLAMVRAQRMRVRVTTAGANGRLDVNCTTGTTPCNTDASLTLDQGVVLSNSGAIQFNTLGQLLDSSGSPSSSDATFAVSYTNTQPTYTVTVSALTGRVSVSP